MNSLEILLLIVAVIWFISIASLIFSVICYYKIFKKAGKGGWEIFIPVYNLIVLTEISGLSLWCLLLFLVPGFGPWIFFIVLYIELAKRFNKGTSFVLGLLFLNPIFIGILAFNKTLVYSSKITNTNVNVQRTFNSNCKRCGAPINIDDKYCMHCGNQI